MRLFESCIYNLQKTHTFCKYCASSVVLFLAISEAGLCHQLCWLVLMWSQHPYNTHTPLWFYITFVTTKYKVGILVYSNHFCVNLILLKHVQADRRFCEKLLLRNSENLRPEENVEIQPTCWTLVEVLWLLWRPCWMCFCPSWMSLVLMSCNI